MKDLTCEVCGKTGPGVAVAPSYFGGFSCALCTDCRRVALEPYSNVVSFKFAIGLDTPIQKGYEDIINRILRYYGKTREDLAADVQKTNEDFEKWCEENS